MGSVKELLKVEEDGTLSFGDYTLEAKTKLDGFEYQGDQYKVKTFQGITKLERNGMFVYESVPGTAVQHFTVSDTGVEFRVSGAKDAQFTLELEADSEYLVKLDGNDTGAMKTNLSGKLSVSAELDEMESVEVQVIKL